MPRPPRPDDLYRLRVAAEPRLSPDGRHAVVALQTVAPGFDGYRDALWLVPTDGSAPARQLTLGAKHDHHPRFSPDGTTLAFISDRRSLIEEETSWPKREPKDREDLQQVHLLSLDGGEARRLTDLPRGVDAFEWSPDGKRLVVVSTSHGATAADDDRRRGIDRTRTPGTPPPSDYRFIDRLDYMLNGAGFTYDRIAHLWLVDVDDRRRDPADRRPGGRPRTGLVARRHAHRLHVEPSARRRHPVVAPRHPCRGRRQPSRHRGHARARVRCSWLRPGCRTAGRSRRSAIGWKVARAAATTSGSSPPTAAMPPRPAAATCPPRTT